MHVSVRMIPDYVKDKIYPNRKKKNMVTTAEAVSKQTKSEVLPIKTATCFGSAVRQRQASAGNCEQLTPRSRISARVVSDLGACRKRSIKKPETIKAVCDKLFRVSESQIQDIIDGKATILIRRHDHYSGDTVKAFSQINLINVKEFDKDKEFYEKYDYKELEDLQYKIEERENIPFFLIKKWMTEIGADLYNGLIDGYETRDIVETYIHGANLRELLGFWLPLIYLNQTPEERMDKSTIEKNAVGFNVPDAYFCSEIMDRGINLHYQFSIVDIWELKFRLGKYWAQMIGVN